MAIAYSGGSNAKKINFQVLSKDLEQQIKKLKEELELNKLALIYTEEQLSDIENKSQINGIGLTIFCLISTNRYEIAVECIETLGLSYDEMKETNPDELELWVNHNKECFEEYIKPALIKNDKK